MPKIAFVAALEREVGALTWTCARVERQHEGHTYTFFERGDLVVVCGGIGLQAARSAAEAVIALYQPARVQSVGFAGALTPDLRVGDVLTPSLVIDARDGTRFQTASGESVLLSFMAVAGAGQKKKLAEAYHAQAVDMEAAAVAAAALTHKIIFGATKVVSDGLDFEMPDMGRFIDGRGRFRTAGFIAFAAVRPWLWTRVATLAGNSRKAAKSLAQELDRLLRELSQPAPISSAQPGEILLSRGRQ